MRRSAAVTTTSGPSICSSACSAWAGKTSRPDRLRALGIELGKARTALELIVSKGEETTAPNEIVLTQRTRKVIELAADEAKRRNDADVSPHHLLLGLVRDGGSIATGILESLGVSLGRVRRQVDEEAVPVHLRHLVDARGRKRDWYCEDVLSGKLTVDVIHEDDRVIAFHHPYPGAVIHAVVVPKAHVVSVMADAFRDPQLLVAMIGAVQEVARKLGLDRSGFRIEANAIAPGVTPHVHWHVMGPGVPPPRREESPG